MKKYIPSLFLLFTLVACAAKQEIVPFGTGFEKVNELSMIHSDINNAYAPSIGEVKMLVVPICFTKGSKLHYWDNRKLLELNSYYFGEDMLSLKEYYETASFGKATISGMVSDIYYEEELSSNYVNDTDDYNRVFDLLDRASAWVQSHYSDVDWSLYDLNNDGYFDNVHMITNYESTEWAEPLWPHMFHTDREKPSDRLGINVYSLSAINHANSSITAIHEQGHIFGLQDYYDYSYSGVSYVGAHDMQHNNDYDWNSFSKICNGWVEPYVYKGEVDKAQYTLKAASLNGDCLIIPANYDTWNGSGFDEYFLIELFSPFGNNMYWWDEENFGEYGVRMYHVDARLWGSNETYKRKDGDFLKITDIEAQRVNSKEDIAKWKYVEIGANNCFYADDYESGVLEQGNYQLLQLIQKGGVNTFGDVKRGRKFSTDADLFMEGDTFTFENYNTFLTKDLKPAEKTNKGEDFTYSIHFDAMNQEEVTLTISRIKK